MTHYSVCTCSSIRTMKLRFLTKRIENLLAERLFVNIHRVHWTINLFSEFFFFSDPSYLIDLTLTNSNCLYGEKLKLSFALTCVCLFVYARARW